MSVCIHGNYVGFCEFCPTEAERDSGSHSQSQDREAGLGPKEGRTAAQAASPETLDVGDVSELVKRLRRDAINFKQHCVADSCIEAAERLSHLEVLLDEARSVLGDIPAPGSWPLWSRMCATMQKIDAALAKVQS